MSSRKVSKLCGIAGPAPVDEPAENDDVESGELPAEIGDVAVGRAKGLTKGVSAGARSGCASDDAPGGVGREPNWPCMYSRRTVSMLRRSSLPPGVPVVISCVAAATPAPDAAAGAPCCSALRISANRR